MSSNKMDELKEIIRETAATYMVREMFLSRLALGALTHDENPKSHFCTYFPAYDPRSKKVFIGLHKKSGLWLFNGGHIDCGETPSEAVVREVREEWGDNQQYVIPTPSLLTITQIENPKKQTCERHFDIWYFFAMDKNTFAPDPTLLSKEFHEWGWKSVTETRSLIKNKETLLALGEIEVLFQ